jgi:hypothetical protein
MADVISLAEHRKKNKPDVQEVARKVVDTVTVEWERFAKINRLNEYFVSTLQVWTQPGVAYLSDLNGISAVEAKAGLAPIIRAPFEPAHMGWKASFSIKNGIVSTPEMPFETYARCFNVLVYITFKREMVLHDMLDEM